MEFYTQFGPLAFIVVAVQAQEFINGCCGVLSEFLERIFIIVIIVSVNEQELNNK